MLCRAASLSGSLWARLPDENDRGADLSLISENSLLAIRAWWMHEGQRSSLQVLRRSFDAHRLAVDTEQVSCRDRCHSGTTTPWPGLVVSVADSLRGCEAPWRCRAMTHSGFREKPATVLRPDSASFVTPGHSWPKPDVPERCGIALWENPHRWITGGSWPKTLVLSTVYRPI